MKAPGSGMLKVASILFIIFGAIAIFFSVIGLACASWAASNISTINAELGTTVAAALTVAAIIALSIGIIGGVLDLILGIMGMKKYADPSKANFFIISGFVLCALQLVSIILSFSVLSVIGFVLPVLFIVGGYQNKNANATPTVPAAQ
jgi:hypothetical protein